MSRGDGRTERAAQQNVNRARVLRPVAGACCPSIALCRAWMAQGACSLRRLRPDPAQQVCTRVCSVRVGREGCVDQPQEEPRVSQDM
eukprot:1782457-Prymnesium_polylepis.1